jgi:hypothetical protein
MNEESKYEDKEIRNIRKSRSLGHNNSRTAINQSKYNNSLSVIPHLQDTFKNGDSYQVMTQAIGQEPLLTTLHPLPAGSRIMGGQEKRLVKS